MRALDDLVRAGKVLYVGISDSPAWVVAQANTLAELRGWSRFVGLQVIDNLAAESLILSDEHMKRLDAVSAITMGFPHDFLTSDQIRGIAYGKTFGLIDDHHKF